MINVDPLKILFLDIETVPAVGDYNQLDDSWKKLWDAKVRRFKKEDDNDSDLYFNNAGIYAEFNKIVCISVGVLVKGDDGCTFRVKSFAGDDEGIILTAFADLLSNQFNKPEHHLCGHNICEFDIPVICRRMLVNGIQLPSIIDTAGMKPWEVRHLDTMVLWRFGDFKNFTSLNLLAALFKIPTPKDDMNGKDVGRVYWHDHNLDRIVSYCQKDVVTVARLFLKFVSLDLIRAENVIIVES
jgi:hypothetical protein